MQVKKPVGAVLAAIEALNLDPIKVKLMDPEEGQGWSRDYVDLMETGYKRFLTLLVKYPDQPIAPTKDVDKFWHGHILDTMKYAEDCEQVFGCFLHHFPYFGMRGEQDARDLVAAAEAMAELYRKEFGEAQPRSVGMAKKDAAWCYAAKTQDAAWCYAASEAAADAAWCYAAKANDAAWCYAAAEASQGADAAWCYAAAESSKAQDAAWCYAASQPAQSIDAAWCYAASEAAAAPDAAWCYAASPKNEAAADAAWCYAAAPKAQGDAAWCYAANTPETAWCYAEASGSSTKVDVKTRPTLAKAA